MLRQILNSILAVCFFSMAASASENGPETKYLMFQIFTFANQQIPAAPDIMTFIGDTVRDIKAAIGTTGDKRHKLGVTLGPLTFDNTDEEIRQLIRKSFQIARAEDVAVAFHIDDSMFYETRKDLLHNPDNIEWIDWNKIPNTGRRLDWSATPSKIAPQMCFNSVEVKNAVAKRAHLIGEEIKKGIDTLKKENREELFAGVIAGWETQIGRDFETNKYLGYCALSHRGFSASHTPADMDAERIAAVKEFVQLWAKELTESGIPKEKIYAHLAFLPQEWFERSKGNSNQHPSYAESAQFATPQVAFSSYYRPGFSTYPTPGIFGAIYQELAKHGNPSWASCEGTNVIPNGFPGEANMETYLAKMFNHGAIFVNIFSWGIGGEAEKHKNFFRLATENAQALSAYKKFLDGNSLKEEPRLSSPIIIFQGKIHKIQSELPLWIQRTHRQDLVMPLMQQLDDLIKSGQFHEADQTADKLLAIIKQQ